jgi:hypothetical protein
MGDVVYTWQAKISGYKIKVLGDATAVCNFNSTDFLWLISGVPIWKRWQIIFTPKSPMYYRGLWDYSLNLYNHSGIYVFITAYIRLALITLLRWIFPLSWLKFLKTHI